MSGSSRDNSASEGIQISRQAQINRIHDGLSREFDETVKNLLASALGPIMDQLQAIQRLSPFGAAMSDAGIGLVHSEKFM